MLILLLLIGALLLGFVFTAVSITVTDRIKDAAYIQGFDAGFTWGERTVHIKEYGDLYV